jgi:hypothetical protein
MKRASFNVDEVTSPRSFPSNRRGFFMEIFQALHHSRRLQAQRVLRQYRHLIDKPEHRKHPSRMYVSEETRVPTRETQPPRRPSTRTPALIQWTLTAIILAMFLMLHVLAGSILQRAEAGANPSSQHEAPSQLSE